jgi:predicted PurR-regulated permease PerM
MDESPGALRPLHFMVVAAAFIVIVAGMRAAADIIVPFLLSVFIAVVVTPAFIAMRRRRVPTAIALLILVIALLAVTLFGVGVLSRSLNSFAADLPDYQDRLEDLTQTLRTWLDARDIELFDPVLADVLNPQAAVRFAGSTVTSVSSLLSNAFIILLIAIFILLEVTLLPAKVRTLPGLSEATWNRLHQIVDDVRHYTALKTVISLFTGVLVTIWLTVLGVHYPLLFGLLAFLLNYVPNIGSFIAAVPAVLLALIQHGLVMAAIVAGGYVFINVLIGNFIEPRWMGNRLGLSPLIILLSLIFWGWVLGPIGMLLSVPLTMTAKIALESSRETQWIPLLMAGSPAPRPPSRRRRAGKTRRT